MVVKRRQASFLLGIPHRFELVWKIGLVKYFIILHRILCF
jgi:hypothetical protein